MTDARLRFAIQKTGRLAEKSLALIEAAGYRIIKGANELFHMVENAPIDVLRVRDDDIATLVREGVADLGVVGLNVLRESHAAGTPAPREVMGLGFGGCTLKIAAPKSFPYRGPSSLEGLRIATSYPRVLEGFLTARSVAAEIVTMRGAVEVAPRLGLAHAICDLVSTGATLEANGLEAVETVLESRAVLIGAPRPVAPPLQPVLASMLDRLAGVTASQGAKYVMMNAPRRRLAEIAAILPGAEAPTVMELAGRPDTVAVHAVCQESVFWETLERLKAVGATALLVLPIEKMM